MFLDCEGSSAITLDLKGRMSIPTKHRSKFVEADGNSYLTMTRHPHGCLLIFPRSTWAVKRQVLNQLPVSALDWKRIFMGNAADLELDSGGRVVVPPELRERVGLNRDVLMMGVGDHFELWDVAAWNKRESEVVVGGAPESIANLIF
jgi:MraZ protein